MVIFDKNNTPDSWRGKVNFVDNNNRLVGYDMESQCCEDFGWKITADPAWTPYPSETGAGSDLSPDALLDYNFVDEEPLIEDDNYKKYLEVCEVSTARFRLTNGDNEAFLWVWNSHNGYYSHGFDYDLGDNKDEGWL